MPGTSDLIDQLLLALASAQARLPVPRLLPGERQRLGGLLLPYAPALTRLVGDALLGDAGAFAGLPVGGAALHARQDEADAWRRLRAALLLLAERAGDQLLLCQADAVQTAQAILEDVAAEGGRCAPDEARCRLRRKRALASADLCLRTFRQKLAPKRAPRPPATPQRRRHAAALIDRTFHQHLACAAAHAPARARTPRSTAPAPIDDREAD